jgi:cell wall-associated NlpC family hydrolase
MFWVSGNHLTALYAERKKLGMTIPLKVVACATGVALAMAAGPMAWAKECKAHMPLRHMYMPAQADALRDALVRRPRVSRAMTPQDRAARAVRFAFRQRGKPYRWGGTGPYGYDCSGLVQRAWRSAGVRIPRVASTQYRRIHRKIRRSRLRAGDLVFFHGFGHVGMYVGRGRFIHSPRAGMTVRVNRLNGHYARSMVGAVRPIRLGWRARRHEHSRGAVRHPVVRPRPVPGAPCPEPAESGEGIAPTAPEFGYCA